MTDSGLKDANRNPANRCISQREEAAIKQPAPTPDKEHQCVPNRGLQGRSFQNNMLSRFARCRIGSRVGRDEAGDFEQVIPANFDRSEQVETLLAWNIFFKQALLWGLYSTRSKLEGWHVALTIAPLLMVFLTIKGVRLDMTDKKGCTGYSGLNDHYDAVLHHVDMDIDALLVEVKPSAGDRGKKDDLKTLVVGMTANISHASSRSTLSKEHQRAFAIQVYGMNVRFLEARFETKGKRQVVVVVYQTAEFVIPKEVESSRDLAEGVEMFIAFKRKTRLSHGYLQSRAWLVVLGSGIPFQQFHRRHPTTGVGSTAKLDVRLEELCVYGSHGVGTIIDGYSAVALTMALRFPESFDIREMRQTTRGSGINWVLNCWKSVVKVRDKLHSTVPIVGSGLKLKLQRGI
ncbi:MAG: hypothetical protein J3Q66DRAFT_405067 [Benniella sp.]|nr:MAG: hypothetical protein J3Q66DRAFT_405067 [Benniella sp.]